MADHAGDFGQLNRAPPTVLQVDPARRTVVVGGQAVPLGGRAFDLLATLAAAPGRIFSANELLAAVWPGQFVEANNLRVQIAMLRRQLGPTAIVNVARRGYALAPFPPSLPLPSPFQQRGGTLPHLRGPHELRTVDLRAIFHLLGECGELWADPQAWQRHLLQGVSRLIGLPVGLHAELAQFGPGQTPVIVSALDHGWASEADARLFGAGHRQQGGPFNSAPLDLRLRERLLHSDGQTLLRDQLMHASELSRDSFHNQFCRSARMDEMVYSAVRTGPGDRFHLLVFGGRGHRPTPRDRDLLRALHRELVPMLGSRLATERDRSLHGLDALQRELLAAVQRGASAADIAAAAGLPPIIVDVRLDALCAHFGVRTPLELMAYLLARRPQPIVTLNA